jgi:DNA-binding NarL/FixJ family response regulator
MQSGQVMSAAARFEEAGGLLADLTAIDAVPWCQTTRAVVLAMAGAVADADEALARAAAATTAEKVGRSLFGPATNKAAAWVAAARGETSLAIDLALRAADTHRARGAHQNEHMCLHDAARFGASRRVAERMRELARMIDGDAAVVFAAHATALATNDADGLDQAASGFEANGYLLHAAEAAAAASAVHHRAGCLSRVHASASQMTRLLSLCEGSRCPTLPSVDSSDPLSAREREVARLAAGGLRNRDIAAKLYLSVRTVDANLRAAYTKLGVAGRHELEAALGLDKPPK